MFPKVRHAEVPAAGGTRGSGQLRQSPWGLGAVCNMFVHACMCVSLGRRQLGRATIQGQLLEGSALYMGIFISILHSQTFILICQSREWDEAVGAACVSAESFCLGGPVGPSVHTHVVRVCLCVSLVGIHAQPRCRLDPGVWSCGSLASVGLPDLVTP